MFLSHRTSAEESEFLWNAARASEKIFAVAARSVFVVSKKCHSINRVYLTESKSLGMNFSVLGNTIYPQHMVVLGVPNFPRSNKCIFL